MKSTHASTAYMIRHCSSWHYY